MKEQLAVGDVISKAGLLREAANLEHVLHRDSTFPAHNAYKTNQHMNNNVHDSISADAAIKYI